MNKYQDLPMKYIYFLLTALLMFAAIPCSANIDPILLDEPNDAVFSCKNDIFIEFMNDPVFLKTLGERRAEGNYLVFRIEMLFLIEARWSGIDRFGFSVEHVDGNGTKEVYPLDYATSMITNLKYDTRTFSDPISFASLFNYYLVFDVPSTDRAGWTFVFEPKARGRETDPYCEIRVPLTIR